MRLFLAINLPAPERDRIQRAIGPLRLAHLPVRWVSTDALHLTLKFLGEVSEERADAVVRAADGVARQYAPFHLELRGLGAFPNLRNPRVVWVAVHAPPELERLAADLDAATAALGFPREARPFSPHLTLGRADRDARAGEFRRLGELAADFDYAGSVGVGSIDLMRSFLSPRGARYECLHAAPLVGAAGPAGPTDAAGAGTSSDEAGS